MQRMKPPPVLDSARVLAYAFVDNSVIYEERGTFFVDGKLLGAVPQLAICQNLGETEAMVFHCDEEWNVLGAAGYATVEKAKQRVERSYKGLMYKWVDVSVKEEEARAFIEEEGWDRKY